MSAPEEPLLFGTRVKQLRERRRLTQQELAALAHTAYNTIWKIECGKLKAPSVYVAARIAIALSTSLDYLAGIYDEHEETPRQPRPPGPARQAAPPPRAAKGKVKKAYG